MMRFILPTLLLATLLGVAVCPTAGRANEPYLVKDINVSANDAGSDPSNFCAVGPVVYFTAKTPTTGTELWKSDGTTAGTLLVKDIFVGESSSRPESLTAVGNMLYFVATDAVNGDALWKTNGTEVGTVLVYGKAGGVGFDSLKAVGSSLYFRGYSPGNGYELWKSDGTAEGTAMVKDIRAGSGNSLSGPFTEVGSSPFEAVGSTLYFSAGDGISGAELWKSDGTAAGTVLVKDIVAGGGHSSPVDLTAVGNSLYFVANNGSNGSELWKSDGTEEGTVMVKDIHPGTGSSESKFLIAVENMLYFRAYDGVHGFEVWKSDGTPQGTVMIKDIFPGSDSSLPGSLTSSGGILYFKANDGTNGTELWKSDGSEVGTVMVMNVLPAGWNLSPDYLTAVGDVLYFAPSGGAFDHELWKSDGTEAGTVMVKDIRAGDSIRFLRSLTAVGNTLFFQGNDGAHGPELWKSDGTELGTVMVRDIGAGSGSSSPDLLTTMGNDLYFRAYDGVNGSALWKSDGTQVGTEKVTHLIRPQGMLAVGNTLYIASSNGGSDYALWKTDGTAGGSVLVKSLYYLDQLTMMGNFLYFRAYDGGINGYELWRSDGTAAGTVMVKDIVEGPGSSHPGKLTVVGNALYFFAYDERVGNQLWKSDGTAAGTVKVKDTVTGNNHEDFLISVGNTLYFEGTDGGSGYELWKSNGTAAGTARVKDIVSGSGSSFPHSPTILGGKLYFAADYGLWMSDGTAVGTQRVKYFYPNFPTVVGNDLYLKAYQENSGSELWKSDGTTAGTVMVKDIRPGSGESYIDSVTAVGNRLYFRASDGSSGVELWRSDGTADGTIMVSDLVAGSGSANPSSMTMAGKRLFFSALSEEEGVELWAMGIFSASFSDITATPAAGNANLVISGHVNPFPNATVTIEYGTTSALGSTHAVGEFSGDTSQPFSATLYPGGIDPVTTYYYRVRATGEFGAIDTGVLSQLSFSEEADLSGISFSPGSLTPPFTGSATNYTCTVPLSVSSVSVTPTKADPNATIEVSVNGESFLPHASGSPIPWPLVVGANQMEIRATAQAGNSRTYAINVTRLDRPMISIFAPSAIGGNGATLGGDVSSDGGAAITERGVIYSSTAINANPAIGGPGVFKEIASGTLGAFTLPVSGLVQGTGYSVKAFATNSEGTTYSDIFVFYTDTTVIWNNGTAFFTHDLVRGGRQRYLLTLDERRIVSFTSEGGSQLRADLRNGSGSVLATFTGDTDVDLEKLLPAGAYVLEVYRTVGAVPSEGYNLTIDASVVPESRPDVTVGTTAAAPVGAESYTPASQSVSLSSLKAGPVTAYATFSNHGNFPDVQSVRASGGDAFFTVSYFGPEGNLTVSLLTGGYRTPGLESGDEAIPIRVSITPNKKKLTKKKGRTKKILKKTLILNLAATSSFDPAIRDEGSIIVQTR